MPVVNMKSDIDASVQRTDSQRSQSNGPRVSFNKDVHVKKIGRRSSDPTEAAYVPNIRRELPADLSEKALKREAALVVSQAEKANRGINRTGSDSKRRREDRAGSIPNRKVVGRSASDASSKKSKRPSIFNFFTSKKNEYNLDEEERKKDSSQNSSTSESGSKRVTRSKSDVGSVSSGRHHDFRKSPRRKSSDSEDGGVGDRTKKNHQQLSPIIEDHQRDDYFEERKTELKPPVRKTYSCEYEPKREVASHEELDLIPSKISKPTNLESILNRSCENMHSSQLPVEKPPLTKGIKVPSMVKRLSMEKLSPPPTTDAFTYFSPPRKDECDKKIIYAEVVCGQQAAAAAAKNVDEPDFVKPHYTNNNYATNGGRRHDDDDFELLSLKQQLSPAEQFASKYKTSQTYATEKGHNYEHDDVILPKIRDLPPEKPWDLGRRGQADGKEYFPEFNDLSNRREELYSRIKSRINREPIELEPKRNLLKEFEALPVDDTLVSRKQVESHRQVHTRRRYEFLEPVKKSYSPIREPSPVIRSPSPFNSETKRHFSPSKEVLPRESFSPEPALRPIREPSPYGKRHTSKESQRDRGEEEIVTTTTIASKGKPKIVKISKKEVKQSFMSPEKLLRTTEKFLDRERRHTDDTIKTLYIYRERSIDDGSRFDPRIDKYETKNSLQRKRERITPNEPLEKSEKRFNSLGRVKQLILGNANTKKVRNNNENLTPNPQPQNIMTADDEMRSRYKEYRGHNNHHLHQMNEVQEIANRRRLSTPRSSPVVIRSVSKSATPAEVKPVKTSWFKSLDRLSRKKSSSKDLTDDEKKRERSMSPFKRAKSPLKPKQNLRFFGDTDQESNASVSKTRTAPKTRKSVTNLKSNKLYSQSALSLNSDSKSKRATQNGRSSSLYDLDKSDNSLRRNRRVSRSRELQNISEDMSTSENENNSIFKQTRKYGTEVKTKTRGGRGHSSSSERALPVEYDRTRNSVDSYDDSGDRFVSLDRKYVNRRNARDESRERQSMSPMRQTYDRELTPRGDYKNKPPSGPPKPARDFQRRKEIERIHDSSGTEGESSQRSIVYLHATTVGDIPPQSYVSPTTRSSSKSVSRSRDDLSYITVGNNNSNNNNNKLEPMTKTVSRSISMLAPWRPKYISDGYEIDYSKNQTRHYVVPTTTSTLPKQHKHREYRERSTRSSDRNSENKEKSRSLKDDYDSSYRSGYSVDHQRRDSPIGNYKHRTKVII